MAKKKDIFNDKTSEIQDLTLQVKKDIQQLDQKLETLADMSKSMSNNRSYQAHSKNMVDTLKTRLLEVTKDFKNALEDRTKTLEQQDKRRQMYSANQGGGVNPFAAKQQQNYAGNPADLEGGGGQAQAVMYHSDRAQAVQNVQRTIG